MAYPTSLDTIADGSLGRAKIDQPGKSARSLDYDIPATEVEAWKSAIVALETEIGATTPATGSLRDRMSLIEAGNIASANTQNATASTLTLSASTRLVRVTYASGATQIDVSALPIRTLCRIWKHNASAYGISIIGDANDQINEGTAAAAMTLPGSTEPMTSTTSCPAWDVYRQSATEIHVMGAPASAQPGLLATTAGTLGLYYFAGNLNDSSGGARNLSVAAGGALGYQNRAGVGKYGVQYQAGRYALASTDWGPLATSCTVEAVISAIASSADQYICELAVAGGSATERMWHILTSARVLSFRFYTAAGATKTSVGTTRLPYCKLMHVAATMTVSGGNTTVKLYVNGALDSTTTHTSAVPNATIVTPVLSACSWIWNSPNEGFADVEGRNEIHGIHVTTTVLADAEIEARAIAALGVGG